MLMQGLKLRNLGRVEERLDLLSGALKSRLGLIVLLLIAQARVFVDGFQVCGFRFEKRLDFPLLGGSEIESLGQVRELFFRIESMVMRLFRGRRSIRGIGGCLGERQ